MRRLVGGYKLLHVNGDGRSNNGVGIILLEEISKQVVRVERWQRRIVMAWVVVQRQMVSVISVYGSQMGRTGVEKQEFRDSLERMMGIAELDMMLCIAGDCNAHVEVAEPGE